MQVNRSISRLFDFSRFLFSRTNCSTDEQCWQDALAYHSAELVEQLFSFSSLAVHMEKFQQSHSSEVRVSTFFHCNIFIHLT